MIFVLDKVIAACLVDLINESVPKLLSLTPELRERLCGEVDLIRLCNELKFIQQNAEKFKESKCYEQEES